MKIVPPPDPDLVNKELERLHTLVRVFQDPSIKEHINIRAWAMDLINKLHKYSFLAQVVIDGPTDG